MSYMNMRYQFETLDTAYFEGLKKIDRLYVQLKAFCENSGLPTQIEQLENGVRLEYRVMPLETLKYEMLYLLDQFDDLRDTYASFFSKMNDLENRYWRLCRETSKE